MKNISLAKLTKDRRNHVESCRINKDTSHRIVANMYSDKTHFIYELIQNADDAGAKNISFALSQDNLKIEHDGRQFDYRNVEAITTLVDCGASLAIHFRRSTPYPYKST